MHIYFWHGYDYVINIDDATAKMFQVNFQKL